MKKVLAIVITVCVVFAAAAALAQPQARRVQSPEPNQLRNQPQANGKFPPRRFNGPCSEFGYCGGGRRGMNFTPDMPAEIREKATELAKLRIDLEEAMSSKPVNKAKALDTFAKIQKVEQEINSWRFAQKLERIEEFRKHRELNKKIPPARPTPVKPELQPQVQAQDDTKDAPEK